MTNSVTIVFIQTQLPVFTDLSHIFQSINGKPQHLLYNHCKIKRQSG